MKAMHITLLLIFSQCASAQNESIESFSKAKKLLERKVYHDHRMTLYCDASFNKNKTVNHNDGFTSKKHVKRSKKIEWEHVVPAENFGRTFTEWRDGHSLCVKSNSKAFKGRKCANKVNKDYRLMQADLYNLYPAIGSVNALRSNYNFAMLPSESSDFGSCPMKIENRKAEPPEDARGRIARTYLYMQATYSRYKMSSQQQKLMNAWNKQYPVSEWECKRAARIEKIQGSKNTVLDEVCH